MKTIWLAFACLVILFTNSACATELQQPRNLACWKDATGKKQCMIVPQMEVPGPAYSYPPSLQPHIQMNPVPILPNPYMPSINTTPGGATPEQRHIFCKADGRCI